MDDNKKALLELMENSRKKIGKPYNAEILQKAKIQAIKGGTLEKMSCRITKLEEQLATTENELYNLTSWLMKYIED